ncbi:MAG: PIN domain-containing protein [Bacteroidota bacterium]|nr:PIN domain-containing protein [Bacteroidota bacterium]
MIEEIFADTSGFVALGNEDDSFHAQADKILSLLFPFKFITTNYVIAETITHLLFDTHHKNAVAFGEMLFSSKNIEIIYIDTDIEAKAWYLFKKYSDKDFSFVDCTSFVVMQNRSIKRVFSCDKHFEQMRFENLLKTKLKS